jgi:hypothetical protein
VAYRYAVPRPRSWNDTQLADAVRESESWSAVVTSLGLFRGTTSYRTVQRHALRLGLNIQHLPAVPEFVVPAEISASVFAWDERLEGLSEAIAGSTSWAEAFRRLGLKNSGSLEREARKYAEKKGIDTSHFLGQAWMKRPVDPSISTPFSRAQDDEQLRRAAPATATAWFMGRGYAVSVPVEPVAYDLVVESDGGFKRIQVKSTTRRERSGRYAIRLRKSQYGASWNPACGSQGGSRPYRPDEVDFFFVVTGDGSKYLIPLSETSGATRLVLDVKYAAFRVD